MIRERCRNNQKINLPFSGKNRIESPFWGEYKPCRAKEVLNAQDRYGLLRYMEPGGGQTAFGEEFTLYANSPSDSIDTSGKGGEA